jgi:hypothetical protein
MVSGRTIVIAGGGAQMSSIHVEAQRPRDLIGRGLDHFAEGKQKRRRGGASRGNKSAIRIKL